MHANRKGWLQELAGGSAPGPERIPVAERIEAPRCTRLVVHRKEGMSSCSPRVSILEQLVAVRLHVDDCEEGNGAVVLCLVGIGWDG